MAPDTPTAFPPLPRVLLRTNGGNFTCKTCKHFLTPPPTADNLRGGTGAGFCVRFPPTAGLAGMQPGPGGTAQPIVVMLMPQVMPSHYCGEYARNSRAEG